jgi:secretion/DNA translocation related TadE-like protein
VRREGGDRGSASIVMLAVGIASLLLALGVVSAGGVLVARHRARNAADAGALAGALSAARGAGAACAAAERLIVANGGRLGGCSVAGPVVTVTVEVSTRIGVGARASAKAGPVLMAPPAGARAETG